MLEEAGQAEWRLPSERCGMVHGFWGKAAILSNLLLVAGRAACFSWVFQGVTHTSLCPFFEGSASEVQQSPRVCMACYFHAHPMAYRSVKSMQDALPSDFIPPFFCDGGQVSWPPSREESICISPGCTHLHSLSSCSQ